MLGTAKRAAEAAVNVIACSSSPSVASSSARARSGQACGKACPQCSRQLVFMNLQYLRLIELHFPCGHALH